MALTATATMAGFGGKGKIIISADNEGRVLNEDLDCDEEYSERIAGIMIPNPNTGHIREL